MVTLISREKECQAIRNCLQSERSEFVIVSGRRRVGKTYLIDTFFGGKFDFTFVGAHNAPASIQLLDFAKALSRHSGQPVKKPKNWYAAFDLLEEYLEKLQLDRKIIVFIDEMPWIDTPKSNFVTALERFWNGWANRRRDVVMIATGSATSWMSDKLLKNKGGLHSRITCNLHLAPFTLKETEEYLRSRNCQWDRYQILQAYMIFGGVPYYQSLLNISESVAQNVDRLFFAPGAQLKDEYSELYHALFNKAEIYVNVVRLLSQHKGGLSYKEISKLVQVEGKFLSKVLDNLEKCDFIIRYNHYGNTKRNALYRLTDYYTLFYYKFIDGNHRHNARWWSTHSESPSSLSWMGLSFELIGLTHHEQIKKALGISGMSVDISTWKSRPKDMDDIPGFQIDMILERADRIVHLCEMKFSQDSYGLTADYEKKLRDRAGQFRMATKNKKSIVHTFITTFGITNVKNHSIVHSEVTMDDLFNS